MRLLLATHKSSLAHDTGPRHPERPARIEAVVRGIRSAGVEIVDLAPEPVGRELLERVHDPDYIDKLEEFCGAGGGALDLDTYATAASWEAALRAASAGHELSEMLRSGGGGDVGYVAMRPPGHHAVHDRAMGFCLFNNIAVTAAALTAGGERVAIVDWDVHHGNGTQETFYADPNVLYLSIHQAGIYPGTGGMSDVGAGDAIGTNLNIPVPAGTGGSLYREAVRRLFVPALTQFDPDWLLVSAGYDAHASDPLAGLMLLAEDYAAMSQELSRAMAPGRSIFFLEGGYDLEALETSAAATVSAWVDPSYDLNPVTRGSAAASTLRHATELVGTYWDL